MIEPFRSTTCTTLGTTPIHDVLYISDENRFRFGLFSHWLIELFSQYSRVSDGVNKKVYNQRTIIIIGATVVAIAFYLLEVFLQFSVIYRHWSQKIPSRDPLTARSAGRPVSWTSKNILILASWKSSFIPVLFLQMILYLKGRVTIFIKILTKKNFRVKISQNFFIQFLKKFEFRNRKCRNRKLKCNYSEICIYPSEPRGGSKNNSS